MDREKKAGRYSRIYNQLKELVTKSDFPLSRMATISAVLHHKMDYFFWTGFYLLVEGDLLVHTYQGPVACMKLQNEVGVCWAGIKQKEAIVVSDVAQFPGHIACDARSQSEIVIPVISPKGEVIGVLDVDSADKASFDEVDAEWLQKIVNLIYS